jgi:hypothetical protein
MSYTITDAEIRKFDSNVRGVYQASYAFGGIFNENNAGGASTYQVVRLGYGMGTRSVPGADITGMGSSTNKTIITLQNWNNAEYVDYFQNDQVNWDAVNKAGTEVCAPAAGRRKTQIVIDTLDGGSLTEVDVDYGSDAGNTGITAAKIQRAASILHERAVPAGDRFAIAPYLALEAMLTDANFTSKDYVMHALNSAQEGKITRFGGFNWIFIPNNPEGGLSYTSSGGYSIYDCYFVHRRALEIALGSANMGGSATPMVSIDKVPQKNSWLIDAKLSCGASIVETDGIVRVKAQVTPIA